MKKSTKPSKNTFTSARKAENAKTPQALSLDEEKWYNLAALVGHWKSDLEFYKVELAFLNNLIKRYFVWLTDDKNIESLRKTGIDLQLTEEKHYALFYEVSKHRKQLINIIENPFSHDTQISLLDEHEQIEREFSVFLKNYRRVKRKIFALTERVIESEKLEHLLMP